MNNCSTLNQILNVWNLNISTYRDNWNAIGGLQFEPQGPFVICQQLCAKNE